MGVAEADSSLGAVDARLVQLRLVTGFVPSGAGAIGQHGDAVPVIELETGDGGVDVGHDEQGCVCCEGEGEGEGSILKPMRGMELEVWDCGKVSKLSGCGAEKSRCFTSVLVLSDLIVAYMYLQLNNGRAELECGKFD